MYLLACRTKTHLKSTEMGFFTSKLHLWHNSYGNDAGQSIVFLPEGFAGFNVFGVDGNTSYRAHLHALRFVKMANALCAFVWVNLIDLFAHVDGLVRALGFAHIAIDALVGDQQSHAGCLFKRPWP